VAAIEAIKLISQPEFLARAVEVGHRLRRHLLQIQANNPHIVGDVRGLGPMLAMEIVQDAASKTPDMDTTGKITAATLARGLITIRAGLYSNCIRLLPPLTVSDDEIDEAMGILGAAVVEASG
jgi:4-aminobutyrate aminotransferase/(S)-3-amino-2-methylpropionate transaminase